MRSVKLSEDNNKILLGIRRTLHLQAIWSVVKIAIVVIPLVAGYIFLQPYLNNVMGGESIGSSLRDLPANLKGVQDLLNGQ
ncbi:MAG: hypothetical protein WA048_00330 [Minisyncoccia bacterium]